MTNIKSKSLIPYCFIDKSAIHVYIFLHTLRASLAYPLSLYRWYICATEYIAILMW